ncbi:MAG: type II secretion system protein GspC [Thermodesulfovibrionales bacterium]|nr:type II secretion system protein GspC [Thermodesulfovibrionales bacterium]
MKIPSLERLIPERLLKDRRVIPAVNAFLGLLLIAAVLFTVRDIASTVLAPKDKAAGERKKAEARERYVFSDYAAILKDNPFGFPGGELAQLTGVDAQAASVSALDISLIGTVSGSRRLSYAVFADKAGVQEVFGIGQSVFGIGALKEVRMDRVFLNANGRQVEIALSDVTTVELSKARAGADALAGFATKTGETTYALDQQRVQLALENPRQIMTDARLLPNIVNGRQEGFSMGEVKPGGVYASLGLRNGDILLRVNEFDISSPEAALQAFTALKGMDRVQLDIFREGSKLTMTYQLR